MQLAFYKGNEKWITKAISFWSNGPYSHVELIFSDGACGSACYDDDGVKVRYKQLDPELWDLVEVEGDETNARKWFEEHSGDRYDYLGLLGFVLRPRKAPNDKWLCTEAVMTALGYKDGWRFCPNALAAIFKKD